MDNNCSITFDLNNFKFYLSLIQEADIINIFLKNEKLEIRGNYTENDSNLITLTINKSIFETTNENLLFAFNSRYIKVLNWLELGTITFYPSEDYVEIFIDSKIRLKIKLDNLNTDNFLELPFKFDSPIYEIDKQNLLLVSLILKELDKNKLYFIVQNKSLILKAGNYFEFIFLENIETNNVFKYKVNYDKFINFLDIFKNGCISTNGNFKLFVEKDKPLVLFINAITCNIYLFMSPYST